MAKSASTKKNPNPCEVAKEKCAMAKSASEKKNPNLCTATKEECTMAKSASVKKNPNPCTAAKEECAMTNMPNIADFTTVEDLVNIKGISEKAITMFKEAGYTSARDIIIHCYDTYDKYDKQLEWNYKNPSYTRRYNITKRALIRVGILPKEPHNRNQGQIEHICKVLDVTPHWLFVNYGLCGCTSIQEAFRNFRYQTFASPRTAIEKIENYASFVHCIKHDLMITLRLMLSEDEYNIFARFYGLIDTEGQNDIKEKDAITTDRAVSNYRITKICEDYSIKADEVKIIIETARAKLNEDHNSIILHTLFRQDDSDTKLIHALMRLIPNLPEGEKEITLEDLCTKLDEPNKRIKAFANWGCTTLEDVASMEKYHLYKVLRSRKRTEYFIKLLEEYGIKLRN